MDKKFKKVFSSIKTRAEGVSGGHGSSGSRSGGMSITAPLASTGTPEGDLLNAIHLFVSTGGPDNPKPGEEFLHLPVIVDNAESSPAAAAQAASALRQYLSSKNSSRPYIHYNSIMLLRILAQNPGYTFTRNLGDAKFLSAVKDLLRNGRDPSVWQILGETLDYFSQDPARIADEGLQPLRDLWTKEKTKRPQIQLAPPPPPPGQGQGQGHYPEHPPMLPPRSGAHNGNSPPARQQLPAPTELAARISEANTSATLLTQLVQSTPQAEIPDNALIREFSDRCKLAAKSMHAYIAAEEPAPPDADTLTTLIETNDVISIALEGHRKAVAAALREKEQFAAVGSARVGDVDDVPVAPIMHGARERRGSSPVSPMSPHSSDLPPSQQNHGTTEVFRF